MSNAKGVKVGYARVSSVGQSLEVQREALLAAGCDLEHIFAEKLSGTTADRPKLREMLRFVRKGDVVHITKFDRLARSAEDLLRISRELEAQGVGLVVLDQGLDTTTSHGKLFMTILAGFAEFETNLRRERQMVGIKAAQQKGVKFGRRQSLPTEVVVAAYREHGSIGKTAKALGSTKTTVHRILTKAEEPTSGGKPPSDG